MTMIVEPSVTHVHVFRRLFVYQVQEKVTFLSKPVSYTIISKEIMGF